jgi:hypothetical protein
VKIIRERERKGRRGVRERREGGGRGKEVREDIQG